MNNGYLGMVRQWQELFWDKRYSHVDMGQLPGLRQARRGLRRPPACGSTDKTTLVDDLRAALATAGPGRRRRPRHPRGERVPDDRARRRRAGHGGLSVMGEPGTKELLSLEELEAAGRHAHRAQARPLDPRREQAGVLTRIAGLFARRGFNIDTLTVGPTDDEHALAHHADGRRRAAPDRPGHQAAAQAGQRPEDPRPRAGARRSRASWRCSRSPPTARSAPRSCRSCEIFRGQVVDVTQALGHRRGHRHDGQDRGVRAHGAPVRPDRDDAHGRDRDLARARRDLSTRCVVTLASAGPSPSVDCVMASDLAAGGFALSAADRERLARRLRARRCGARGAARRGARRDHACASTRGVDPSAVAFASRRAGEPWFCFEQPDRDRAALAALGPRRALRGVAGPTASRRSRARWRALAARAVADPPDGPRGSGLVAVGGFAFAPDGGRAPHWAGFAPASLHVPEVALARRGERRAADGRALGHARTTRPRICWRASSARLAELRPACRCRCSIPIPAGATASSSAMPPEHYEEAVARAVERIRAGELEKIVLAREVAGPRAGAHDAGRGARRAARGLPVLLRALRRPRRRDVRRRHARSCCAPRRRCAPRRSRSPARRAAAPIRPSTTTSASSCCARDKDREEQAIVVAPHRARAAPARASG